MDTSMEGIREYACSCGAQVIKSGGGECICTAPDIKNACKIIAKALMLGYNAKYERFARKVTISYFTL